MSRRAPRGALHAGHEPPGQCKIRTQRCSACTLIVLSFVPAVPAGNCGAFNGIGYLAFIGR
jgi:hypothetical protein